MIDVSVSSIQCGLVYSAIKAIRNYLLGMQGYNIPEKVAVITFDRNIHLYCFSVSSESLA